MNDDMREVITEFLVESSEGIDRLDRDLVELESDPASVEALSSIFRTMHTIKGTCGFLGFSRLEAVAHAAENLLSALRDRQLSVDRPIIDSLFASVDAVRAMLAGIEAVGDEPPEEYLELRDLLGRLLAGEKPGATDEAAPADGPRPQEPQHLGATTPAVEEPAPLAVTAEVALVAEVASVPDAVIPVTKESPVEIDPNQASVAPQAVHQATDDAADAAELAMIVAATQAAKSAEPSQPATAGIASSVPVERKHPAGTAKRKRTRRVIGEILKEKGYVSDDDLMLGVAEQSLGDSRQLGQILQSLGIVSEEQLLTALREQQVLDEDRQQSGETTVRVDVQLLDTLMNLIGELVLARNQLVQLATDRHDAEFLVPAQRLNIITSELQAGVMKTRMQPIGSQWQRLPRMVRDLTVSLGKQVKISVEGSETELDRTILEAIKDPLTHIVRNAVDHGIETTERRVSAGKEPEGTLHLRAYHESGKMNIEITDDGAGIDPDRIREKALAVGLLTVEQSSKTSDQDVLSCIFAPGFSTAAAVTNISGRGVGMDVVRTNIEKIGGSVEIQSELGRGTTIRIKIPLTLAIVPALVVLSGGQRYVIPQVNLVELVRLDAAELTRKIELIHGTPVYRLRGRLLPIVDLADLLSGGSGVDVSRISASMRSVNVVVLQADGQSFGLVVDGVFDTQEIVVKPLGSQLRDIRVFAGATIMGDGKLALILDVVGLARESGVMKKQLERPISSRGSSQSSEGASMQDTLVVVRVGDEQTAIPLSRVSRLEHFELSLVERTQGRQVVQYRGEVLPLLELGSAIGVYGSGAEREQLAVLVHNGPSGAVGVVVDSIIDITPAQLDRRDAEGFVLGTAIVDSRVTTVIDTRTLIQSIVGHDISAESWTDTNEMAV